MRLIIYFIISLFVLSNVIAVDLSDYPVFFIKDNELDVIIVAGDDAAGTDALAQTQIALSLAQYGDALGITKLASEVDYEGQNIISIGNPCVNSISDEIMDEPNPCNKDFPRNSAKIFLFEHEDNVQLVVAGYSDEGTREIANILRDFDEHDLEDYEFTLEREDEEVIIIEEQPEVEEEVVEEPEEEPEVLPLQPPKEEPEEDVQVKLYEEPEEVIEEEPEEIGFFQRIINFIRKILGIK